MPTPREIRAIQEANQGGKMGDPNEDDLLQRLTRKAWPANRPARRPPKVGRNELCPCGSKKKYKKYCLNKDGR